MNMILSRRELQNILKQWLNGSLSAADVHAWAEERYLSESYEPEDQVTNIILRELDTIDMNLITKEDVPIFLEMVNDKALTEQEAEKKWNLYSQSIDLKKRMKELASDPLYAPFCLKS